MPADHDLSEHVAEAKAGAEDAWRRLDPQLKTRTWYLDAAWHRHGDDEVENWGKVMVVE